MQQSYCRLVVSHWQVSQTACNPTVKISTGKFLAQGFTSGNDMHLVRHVGMKFYVPSSRDAYYSMEIGHICG